MGRYRYDGPYDMIEFEGKQIMLGQEVDLSNDEFIYDMTWRGYHLFTRLDQASTGSPAPAVAEVSPELAVEEPTS